MSLARKQRSRGPRAALLAKFAHLRIRAEREAELGERLKAGDWDARDELVRAAVSLVGGIAWEYVRGGSTIDIEDLVSEGLLGAFRAAETWDPAGGTWRSYVAYWIHVAIRGYLTYQGTVIALPKDLGWMVRMYDKATLVLTLRLNRPPTDEEVGHELAFTGSELGMIRKARAKVHSASQIGEQRKSRRLQENLLALRNRGTERPETPVIRAEEQGRLAVAFAGLKDRQRTILGLRYGLNGAEALAGKEVGAKLGMSMSAVYKAEYTALGLLRKAL
jgi:RNA polymerase primary sigma factor